MPTVNQSSARTTIGVADAAEIARMARDGDPNLLTREDMEALLGDSALVLDGLRRRPRYFDGRFLTGADLSRDQDYVRQRQADLARACGTGVVTGLEVGLDDRGGGDILVITPGHGVTPSGDIVTVMTRREIAPLDLPSVERLDATLGLRASPRLPLGRRTGVFLLALRAVEFSANPIAAYPTTVSGARRVEDGDVIEATAITLIPWSDTGAAATLGEARREIARRVFLGDASGAPQDALPLAMLAMERGAVRWVDTAMVRRETGADTPLQVSMGARPRALAEAFVLQHRRHLGDVLAERAAASLPSSFAAAQYFAALPAAGQLPAAAIQTDALGFRQLWFPPAVDVEISFIPSDEVAALVEESLTMPPVDLAGDPADLDATAIVVLVPVTRQRLQRLERALGQLSTVARPDPGQGVRRPPAQMLASMLARNARFVETQARDSAAVARAEAADARTRAWQAAWAESVAAIPAGEGMTPLVWYVRRRAIPHQGGAVGVPVAVTGDDTGLQQAVEARLRQLGLAPRLAALAPLATPFATARILSFLGAPRLSGSVTLTSAALRDLEAAAPRAAATGAPPAPDRLDEGEVIAVASRYGDARLGDGLERIAAALAGSDPLPAAAEIWLGGTGMALDVDQAARDLAADSLAEFAAGLRRATRTQSTDELRGLLEGVA